MARSFPAQTMGQVAIRFTRTKPLKGKIEGGVTTHYNMTLQQADREGIIQLDADGKIAKIVEEGINIDLPKTLQPEDVFAVALLTGDDDS